MWKKRLKPKLIRLEETRIKDARMAPLPNPIDRISRRGTQAE